MKNQDLGDQSARARRSGSVLPIHGAESALAARLRISMRGESQAAFARRAGVSESLLRQYLNGAMPSTDRLVRLAEAGNVSIAWLATGEGEKERGAAKATLPAFMLEDLPRLTRTVALVERALSGSKKQVVPASKRLALIFMAWEFLGDDAPDEKRALDHVNHGLSMLA